MQKREQLLRLAAIPGITGRRWLSAAQQLSEDKDVDDVLTLNGFEASQRHYYHHISPVGWRQLRRGWQRARCTI